MSTEPLSLVFTGHMVDLPERSPPRFPPELEDAARIEIERRIACHTQGQKKAASRASQVSRAAATNSFMRSAEAMPSIQ
jgi:hypothetical protein